MLLLPTKALAIVIQACHIPSSGALLEDTVRGQRPTFDVNEHILPDIYVEVYTVGYLGAIEDELVLKVLVGIRDSYLSVRRYQYGVLLHVWIFVQAFMVNLGYGVVAIATK